MQTIRRVGHSLISFTRYSALLLVLVSFFSLCIYTYTRVTSDSSSKAYAATSSTLNFQGRLLQTSGQPVADGYYNIEFKLYTGGTQGGGVGVGQANAGTLEWTETYYDSNGVTAGNDNRVRVVNGYFTVNLGSLTSYPGTMKWDQEHWLTMNVGGSAQTAIPTWDGEMLAPGNTRTKLTATPYSFASLQARKLIDDQLSGTGTLEWLTLTGNRTISLPDADGTVLLNSTGFANNGNSFSGTATLGTNDANDLILETGGVEGLRIDQDGDVGIGTLADAVEKLEVNGGIKLGNTSNANAGTIRWTGTDFEGYNGSQWVSLTLASSSTSANLTSGVANLAGTATGAATGLLAFTSAAAVSNTAGSNTFVAPSSGSFRSCLVVGNANRTAGTATVRWRVNGVSVGAGVCQINGTNVRTASQVIAPNTVTFNAGDTLSVVFDTVGLTPAAATDYTVYWSVDYGTSGANGTFFVQGGNTFGTTAILGTTDNQGLSIVTNNTQALNITNTGQAQFQNGVSVANVLQVLAGGANITGGIDNNGDNITNVGALSGVTTLTASGALSAATATDTINGLVINAGSLSSIAGFNQASGNFDFNNGTGTFSINSSGLDVSTAGALSGITTINMSGDVTVGGFVLSDNFDRSTAGALSFGNTNATSVSFCNSANCDTITLGTNADADVIQIGDGSDTITITGGSGSTIVWNGVTIDATELSRLDGKDAALVDENDFTTGDGTGATSSGSGLEAGTGGIGLLQGCANNEGLVWNDGSSVWGCALATLDTAYTNDADKTLTVNNAAGLTFDLTTTGGLFIEDAGVVFASFTDTGGITFQPAGTSAVTFNLDDNSAFIVNGTVTNTGFLQDMNLTFGADGAGDTVSALNINVTSANDTTSDQVLGVNIDNLTGNGANTVESGLRIGTGWSASGLDADIEFDDTTPVIRLGATDNTGILSITDSAATPNTLLRIQDHSTNFGASVEAGAFISYNSMYADEFFKDRAQVAADGNQNWGDNTEWNTNETGTCTWDGTADAINGITSMLANAAGSTCTLHHSDLGAATPNTWVDADNLPTIVMKVRPSVAGAGVPDTNHQFFAGIYDGAFNGTPASGAPVNGIYFSNASDAAGVTGTANWYAVTDNGAAVTNTACGVAVSETAYALLVIKVMSTSLVKFYIDNDVSNGVNLVECGTGNTLNINTAGMTPFMKADWDAGANASTLDIDYYRLWQDDAAPPSQGLSEDGNSEESVVAQSAPLQVYGTQSALDSRTVLSELMVAGENMEYSSGQRLDLRSLTVGEGIVSPLMTTNSLLTNNIESATGTDIVLNLDQNGALVFRDKDGQETSRIDGQGNATFGGTVTADALRVGRLELDGIDFLEPLEEVKARIDALESRPTTVIDAGQLDLSSIELGSISVIGQATFKEAVRFEKDVEFAGQINVLGYSNLQGLTVNLDLITKGSLIVEGKATFKEMVQFEKDVQFASNVEVKGEFTTNNDTAGTSKIKTGEKKVKVEFSKPKTSKPIITVSVGNGKFVQYSYQNVTETGFEIVLPNPADEDLEFSWIAIQAQQPQVVQAP